MILYQCDKCGKVNKDFLYKIDLDRITNSPYPYELGRVFCDKKDLCGKCFLQIMPVLHQTLLDFINEENKE